METLEDGGFSNLAARLKAFFFPKSGGNVSGPVNASGEVTAHETVSGSSVAHNLTEKLDEEDYLHGMTWDELEARFTWDDLDGTSTSGSDTYTENLNLTKPGRLSTAAINNDLDILDTKIGAVGSTSLQSQIDALNDATATSALQSLVTGINYSKFGNIVVVNVQDYVMTNDSFVTVGTLGSAYRPLGMMTAPIIGDFAVGGIDVAPNGNVRIFKGNIAQGTLCYGAISFIVQ